MGGGAHGRCRRGRGLGPISPHPLGQKRERRTEPTPNGAAAMIGQTLGHYRIDSKLGEGGMGVVYRAFDTHLDRAVAIKVLRPDATASPDRRRRFVQEAKSASALNHPGIVHIYDIDSANLPDGPTDFIAMEFVSGKTLDQYIGKSGLSLNDALKYGIQIADALARAH